MRHYSCFSQYRRLFAGASAIALVAATDATAQLTTSVDAVRRSVTVDNGAWQQSARFGPAARYDLARFALGADATMRSVEQGGWSTDGSVNAALFSPIWRHLSATMIGSAERTDLDDGREPLRAADATAWLAWQAGSWGTWASRGARRDNRLSPVSPLPNVALGGWRQTGNAIWTLSMSSAGGGTPGRPGGPPTIRINRDSLGRSVSADTTPNPGSPGESYHWTDAEAGVHWMRGRVALSGLVATRMSTHNVRPESWGQLDGTLALSPQTAVVVAAGSRPASIAYGLSHAAFFNVGLRVSPSGLWHRRLPDVVKPSATGFDARRETGGRYTVRVRVPNARVVELSGDFTSWTPVRLERTGGDLWEVVLPITAGTHRVVIRVDGAAWTAPPGATSVPDDFEGTVGLVVIR
jgi:hypothetical protein